MRLVDSNKMINYKEEVKDWKDAIRICCEPLLSENYIKPSYVDAIYDTAEKLGPYFDFGKGIAVPHARPETGVLKTGLSILKLNKPVNLLDDEEHPIDVFIVLSAKDNTSHVELLRELSTFLMNNEDIKRLKASANVDDIINLLS